MNDSIEKFSGLSAFAYVRFVVNQIELKPRTINQLKKIKYPMIQNLLGLIHGDKQTIIAYCNKTNRFVLSGHTLDFSNKLLGHVVYINDDSIYNSELIDYILDCLIYECVPFSTEYNFELVVSDLKNRFKLSIMTDNLLHACTFIMKKWHMIFDIENISDHILKIILKNCKENLNHKLSCALVCKKWNSIMEQYINSRDTNLVKSTFSFTNIDNVYYDGRYPAYCC